LAVSFTYNGSTAVPTAAGSYTVIGTITDPNYQGSATGTLVIAQASGSITLSSLSQTYNGSPKPATAITTPSGLAVSFTYNGSTTVPTAAGSYTVIGTITDPNYQGSATSTLVIAQASGSITLSNLSQTYNGSPEPATATTVPSGLAVSFTYNGSSTVPTNAGTYTVIGTITDPNYQGSATNALVIAQASGSIILSSLSQTYNGAPEPATAITTPSGLAVSFTYNGSSTVPTTAGSYIVIGTITDPNYQGSATNSLVINAATISITNLLLTLNKLYDGTTNIALNVTNVGLAGVAAGDSLTLVMTNAQAYLADKNAGSNKLVTVTGLSLAGAAATNYSLPDPFHLTANILPVTLTITANNTNKLVGQDNPSLTASYAGFVGGDDTNALSAPVVLSTTATAASIAGNYPITASGASATNYLIQYFNGNLRVILNTQLVGAQVTANGSGIYVVSWPTISGQTYQLEYEDDLTLNNWQPVGTPFPGVDGVVAITNNLPTSPQRFYRVQVQ